MSIEFPAVRQPELFSEIAVHCIFDSRHVVRRSDPEEAHEAMEQHYREEHQADIDAVLQRSGT